MAAITSTAVRVDFARGLSLASLDAETLRHARRHLIDTVGALLIGSARTATARAEAVLLSTQPGGAHGVPLGAALAATVLQDPTRQQSVNAMDIAASVCPIGMPPDIVKTLNEAMTKPEVKAQLLTLEQCPLTDTPQGVGQRIATQTKRWAEVIRVAKVPKE